jgi:D-alanine-D-alanine ligase-like ATP-grasp enzyme
MTELGLGYGALDFVVDQDTSQWVFLEINAGGNSVSSRTPPPPC